MYHSSHLGFLGQATAGTRLTPGQQYTIQFSIETSGILASAAGAVLPTSLQIPAITALVGSYSPFSSGMLGLLDVETQGSTVTLTIIAGPGSDVLELGGIAAAIADTLNKTASGYTFTVLGLGGGLGTTTYGAQLEQQGGVIFNPAPGLVAGVQATTGYLTKTGTQILTAAVQGAAAGVPAGFSLAPLPSWVWWVGGGTLLLLLLTKL